MATRPTDKANRFVVELANADLPDRVAERVDSAVQKAVLGVLADLDLAGDVKLRFRPEWRGIWIDLGKQKIPGF